jgi:molybdate transport system substrate-binding protein
LRRQLLLVGALIGALVLGATPVAAKSSNVKGSVTVLAASSLTETFTKVGRAFEHRHPRSDVTFSFNSTATLVTQIQQGAPADVIASADDANMQKLVDGGQVARRASVVFARNRLEIAVEPGNPKHIETLADTLKPGVTLVLCAPEVPCGKYALEAYGNAGLAAPSVPTGANAKDTMSKVSLGEADAAVVYVTDVKTAKGDVDGVTIPSNDNVIATYPIAPVSGAANLAGAKAFAQYVTSKPGQRTLRRYGFLAP